MTTHFKVKLRNKEGGFRLTVDNYIKLREKDNEELLSRWENAQTKFYLNMKFFKSLPWNEFNEELCNFVDLFKFHEITDFNDVCGVKGFYVMVLDDYCQVYIGIGEDIGRRIKQHWGRQVPLDKLVFNDLEECRLSIDSFRAMDTTRLFVRPCPECHFRDYPLLFGNPEDQMVRQFPSDYCINGGYRGWTLKEILEAKERRKKFFESILNDNE